MLRHEVSLAKIANQFGEYADSLMSSLAYCELYITLAALIFRVLPEVQLFETVEDDVKYHHDSFVPGLRPESKGVRICKKERNA
jgi:hypothetical protein